MAVNWENAEKVLDAIDSNRQGFDMSYWKMAQECGTTRCIAGWAAHLDGWSIGVGSYIGRRNGQIKSVWQIATDYLGIEVPESDMDGSYEDGVCPTLDCSAKVYRRLFGAAAYPGRFGHNPRPSTDEIRARLKEFD